MKLELFVGQKRFEQGDRREFDSLGVGTTVLPLEFHPPPALDRCHPALAPQWAVVEVVDEPAIRTHGKVEVEGEVLGVLEGFKAVDDEGFG